MLGPLISVTLVCALAVAALLDSVAVVPIAVLVVFRVASALADRRYRAAR